MRRRIIVSLLMSLALLGSLASMAAASCMFDDRPLEEQLADVDIVFVGTVVEVRHDTTAVFEVAEVWKGDLPAEVVVLGGSGQPGAITSVDRFWQQGVRYLVAPQVVDRELHDNSCSPTREWTDDLADARPAGAASPGQAEGRTSGMLFPVLAVAALGAVAATALLLRQRGSTREG